MDMSLSGLGSWWWTGRPGMLQSVGLQRVGHDWATELNWRLPWIYTFALCLCRFLAILSCFSLRKAEQILAKIMKYVYYSQWFNLLFGGPCSSLIRVHFSLPSSLFPSVHTHNFYFFPCYMACGILVPLPGMEPVSPALEAWSLIHWTAREVLREILGLHILVLSGVPVCDESPSDILLHISNILILQKMSSNM